MQYCMSIKPALRLCLDYIFIFREAISANRKKLYEQYCGMFPTQDVFNKVLDACTENYQCLVINQRNTSNRIEDCVFYYKADLHDNEDWRVGSPEFWNFHEHNYKEEEDEPDYNYTKRRRRRKGNQVTIRKV